jgi:hypothetical protein
MARITGRVLMEGKPADDAYVQLRDENNDFIGETRADENGRFVLYAVPGTWQVAAWLPAGPRGNQLIRIEGAKDVEVECVLAPVTTPTLRGAL